MEKQIALGCMRIANMSIDKLLELANKYNVSKNAVAIAWILKHPSNITPILGTTSIIHLLEINEAKKINLSKKEWYELFLASGQYLP